MTTIYVSIPGSVTIVLNADVNAKSQKTQWCQIKKNVSRKYMYFIITRKSSHLVITIFLSL